MASNPWASIWRDVERNGWLPRWLPAVAGTIQIKVGPGILSGISQASAGVNPTLTFYDAASGTAGASLVALAPGIIVQMQDIVLPFHTGLVAVVGGGTPASYLLSFR